ncbi:Intercellular adhesion protein R [Acholeplasma oculi]|uniref:Transcriptional regulator, TetR family n=1 Tax=Acholeplasma oculi TaxID=35623 RepID=A0A061A917_9MOLU|nr:TetR/AcrR family transcriptional regulator [Acholeplasma oculi]CDR30338.1 Transcriptional regulator, TetR family [Acholeplasma oculi]SKC42552.1 transcriptional regulator, TetR family [Acholeplasma oculi]SUT88828.1 Intercellular adhesion protein R [Acholeplasma oculi]
MTTKESIYHHAIELFSKHGYHQLGMRDLAKSVGIKASSIYNHYKSKEDILLDICNELLDGMKKHIYPLYKNQSLNPRLFFTTISLETNKFFETPKMQQLTKLLIPLQYEIPRLKEIILNEFIYKPRTAYSYYFNQLMQQGKMKKTDAMLAAKIYHSFFIYHFHEKFLTNEPNNFLLTYEELFKSHIDFFMNYFEIS